MQEKALKPSDDKDAIKKEILETLEQIDVLQKQDINLFDKPEAYNRVFHLLNALDAKIHELNHFFVMPDNDKNRSIQDLFFSVKKMKDALENLKADVHRVEFQRAFIDPIDHIKRGLNQLA